MQTCELASPPAAQTSTAWKSLLLWSDVVAFLALTSAALVLGPQTIWKALGFGLSVAGFVPWMIARRQLGRSFSATAQARALVSTGLYRRFRHPIYYFGGVAHIGAFLALQAWWLMATWALYCSLIQWKRIRNEEAVLEAAFGEEFRQLRRGAWF